MSWIRFSSCDGGGQSLLNTETGRELPFPGGDGLRRTPLFLFPGGRYACLSVCAYTLRGDMARSLRPRFFRVDLDTGEREELLTGWDRAGVQVMTLLPAGERLLAVASAAYDDNRLLLVSAHGRQVSTLWRGSAYPYWLSLSPAGDRLSFHLAGFDGALNPLGQYSIVVLRLSTGEARCVRSQAEHLFFGPEWSPDGSLLAFQDCVPAEDPGHHFADVCVCAPDGTGFRRLTRGRSHYYGTSYGLPAFRGGGSNCVRWTPPGQLLDTVMPSGAHPDARYDGTRPNHEELVYDPAAGRGGSYLRLLDPGTGEARLLTRPEEGRWDFRPCLDAAAGELLYTSCRFGEASRILAQSLGDGGTRELTRGRGAHGADYAQVLELTDARAEAMVRL